MRGEAENFERYPVYPLKIKFYAPIKQGNCNQRCFFEKYIQNDTNIFSLEFYCKLYRKNSKPNPILITLSAKDSILFENVSQMEEYIDSKYEKFGLED
jgi:hypothetical protein